MFARAYLTGVAALAMAFGIGGYASELQSPIRQALGVTAQTACNAAFVSRIDAPATVRAELHEEAGMRVIDWAIKLKIDEVGRTATARLPMGAGAKAVYRDGRGCTLIIDREIDPKPLPRSVLRDPAMPPIARPKQVRAVDRDLSAAIDATFVQRRGYASPNTSAVVVLHRGARYWRALCARNRRRYAAQRAFAYQVHRKRPRWHPGPARAP